MKSDNPSWFWFFNGLMLWGAGLGWLIGASVLHLRDTIRHQDPGIVHYGDGERSAEFSRVESESQYKRHNYTMGGMMLTFGLVFWFAIAKTAKREAVTSEAKHHVLETQIRRAEAFQRAFASAVDDVTRDRASAEARSSADFQAACDDEAVAWRAYSTASKAAKGDDD